MHARVTLGLYGFRYCFRALVAASLSEIGETTPPLLLLLVTQCVLISVTHGIFWGAQAVSWRDGIVKELG